MDDNEYISLLKKGIAEYKNLKRNTSDFLSNNNYPYEDEDIDQMNMVLLETVILMSYSKLSVINRLYQEGYAVNCFKTSNADNLAPFISVLDDIITLTYDSLPLLETEKEEIDNELVPQLEKLKEDFLNKHIKKNSSFWKN